MKRLIYTNDFLIHSWAEESVYHRWLPDFFRPIWKAVTSTPVGDFCQLKNRDCQTFSREQFFALSGISDVKPTYFSYDSVCLSEASKDYLRSFLDDVIIIGLELGAGLRELLTSLDVTYLSMSFHSFKLLDDLPLLFTTNRSDLFSCLESYRIPSVCFEASANYWKIYMREHRSVNDSWIEDNSVLFIGQMPVDESTRRGNDYLTILDFAEELENYARSYSRIYYVPHPFLPDREVLFDKIRQFPFVTIVDNMPTYHLLASEKIVKVIGISSSVLYEAQYFGKEIEYLYRPLYDIDVPFAPNSYVSIGNAIMTTGFWHDLFGSFTHVYERQNVVVFPEKCNRLRELRELYWGYSSFDKTKQLESSVSALKCGFIELEKKIVEPRINKEDVSLLSGECFQPDASINRFHQECVMLECEINRLHQECARRDDEINRLHQECTRRDDIIHTLFTSKGWRMLTFYYRLSDKIIPPRSLQRRIAASMYRSAKFFIKKSWQAGKKIKNKLVLYDQGCKAGKAFPLIKQIPILNIDRFKEIVSSLHTEDLVIFIRGDLHSSSGYANYIRDIIQILKLHCHYVCGADIHYNIFDCSHDSNIDVYNDSSLKDIAQFTEAKHINLLVLNITTPDNFAYIPGAQNIGCFFWETDRFPPTMQWKNAIEKMDYMWAPTGFVKDVIVNNGYSRPVAVIPWPQHSHKISTTLTPVFISAHNEFAFVVPESLSELRQRYKMVFLAIKKYCPRKGFLILLEEWMDFIASTQQEKVCLIIKTSHLNNTVEPLVLYNELTDAINTLKRQYGLSVVHIYFIFDLLDNVEMEYLYACSDAQISTALGEGFGGPVVESLLRGKPAITARHSSYEYLLSPDYPLLMKNDYVNVGLIGNDIYSLSSKWSIVRHGELSRAIETFSKMSNSQRKAVANSASHKILASCAHSIVERKIFYELKKIGFRYNCNAS